MNSPYIIVCDDHPLVQAALRGALQQAFPGALIREAGAVEDVVDEISKAPHAVDLVLLDLNMPGNAGFSGLLLLLASFPHVPVAILSAQEAPATIRKAISLGASGYLPKTTSLATMAEAIQRILNGDVWLPQSVSLAEQPESEADIDAARRLSALSPQQLRILARVVEGKLNKQIAGELNIAEQTVKVHVSIILRKLGVITRTQAAILVERSGGWAGESGSTG
jgi:DNA-binding NarL/FixJ family response regulator